MSFLLTFLQFDPKQKAVCIIPTSLHFKTIITAASAKRCRPRRKSRRSPPRPVNSHSDRLSLHAEVTGKYPESSPTTSRPPRHPHQPTSPVTGPLCLWHILVTLSPSCFQLAGGGARRRSGSGCIRRGRLWLFSDSHTNTLMWFLGDSQTGWCCRCWTLGNLTISYIMWKMCGGK